MKITFNDGNQREIDFSQFFEYNSHPHVAALHRGLTKESPLCGDAALLGAAYNGHNSDFNTTYSLQLMYKQYFKGYNNKAYCCAQLTGVWSTSFANRKLTFAGFFDFWRGEKANRHGQLVFLTEPQLWYNISNHFGVGTEIEMNNNFIFNLYNDKTFFFNSTLALKFIL